MREAVILAGGLGTRLRSVVADVPKPMALVAGRPFLEILLASLGSKGFGRAVLALGYKSEVVTGYFGRNFRGMELAYSIESEPLGTGGALRLALSNCERDGVFVFNGDTYLELDVDALDQHRDVSGSPVIVARQVADTARYGRLDTEDGIVHGFAPAGTGGPGLINAGCYFLPTNLLEQSPLERFSFEQDFLAAAVQRQRFDVFISDGQFIDIGVPEDYLRAQIELAGVAS